jgi:predicted PurR-regulated permease PerM
MDAKRLLMIGFGVSLAVPAGVMAYRFVAPLTVGVFVYYSTRPFYRELRRFGISSRVRAVLVILLFSLPIVLIMGYTAFLLLREVSRLSQEYEIAGLAGTNSTAGGSLGSFGSSGGAQALTPEGILEAYRAGELDAVVDFLSSQAPFVFDLMSNLFVNMVIVVIVTYYLLVDGWRIRELLLRYDEDGVLREYFDTADEEISAAFVGNFLNVVIISAVAMVVYAGYNFVVPASVEVPFPALAGALTGIASLVPVVGMKIVYVPLAVAAGAGPTLAGDTSVVGYLVAFLIVAFVLVDTIPDVFLRPYLSGDCTHVGLLMLAYIIGPLFFGFHGLFLAPLILLLGVTFFYNVLPYLLGGEKEGTGATDGNQSRLDDYAG